MPEYIADLKTLELQASFITVPTAIEVRNATEALLNSPVADFEPFSSREVQLVGKYRAFVSRGSLDVVWKGIVQGDWNAWLYAIHESSELQAFADLGANPFDRVDFEYGLVEAHIRATLSELKYCRRWAEQIGQNLPEIAIEMANPMRSLFPPAHRRLIQVLQMREDWVNPTEEELQSASAFWQRIRGDGQ